MPSGIGFDSRVPLRENIYKHFVMVFQFGDGSYNLSSHQLQFHRGITTLVNFVLSFSVVLLDYSTEYTNNYK